MLKILHVEDDELYAGFVSSFILKDHQVVWTPSGEKAIEICKNEHFDLILQDIGLPGVNGCKVIDTIAETKPISFLFLTNHPEILSEGEMKEYAARRNTLCCGLIDKRVMEAYEQIKHGTMAVETLIELRTVSGVQKHKPLSPAEKDILLDLKKKMLPKQIAVKRDASVRTIYTHKNNINQKLGERS